MKRDEIAVGMVIFLFGAVTAWLSLKMPIGTFRMAGTGLFPFYLGICLMLLSGAFVFKTLYQVKKNQSKKEASRESIDIPVRLILFLGAMVLATAVFNLLGYPLTSFLLMVGLLKILGVKWRVNLPLSFLTAMSSYFLFVKWLEIPMPKGWIGI